MDPNDYWQENKRFVVTVAGGVLLFVIGELMIGKLVGQELTSQRVAVARLAGDLRTGRFRNSDQTAARVENEALRAAVDGLSQAVAFEPRPEFVLDPARGSAGTQYFARVSAVRDRLRREAGRLGVRLKQDLGLPALAPTRDDEIERTLEALDLVERAVTIGLEVGVPRIDKIEIRLDPGLRTRKGVGRMERTQVKMRFSGPSGPLVRFLVETQSPARGPSLLIGELEMAPERQKADEAWLEATFVVVRLHGLDARAEGED